MKRTICALTRMLIDLVTTIGIWWIIIILCILNWAFISQYLYINWNPIYWNVEYFLTGFMALAFLWLILMFLSWIFIWIREIYRDYYYTCKYK